MRQLQTHFAAPAAKELDSDSVSVSRVGIAGAGGQRGFLARAAAVWRRRVKHMLKTENWEMTLCFGEGPKGLEECLARLSTTRIKQTTVGFPLKGMICLLQQIGGSRGEGPSRWKTEKMQDLGRKKPILSCEQTQHMWHSTKKEHMYDC